MVYLTIDDILAIREEVARECANSCGIRRPSSLYAAIESPRAVLFGQELFSTLAEKAAALLYGLIHNHPFWDGNKRIATRALRLFLQRNGMHLSLSDEDVRAYARDIARGTISRDDVAEWLKLHIEDNA